MDLNNILIGVLFVVGFLLHVLKVAQEDVAKTLFPNKLAWFKIFWPNVVVRAAIVTTLWIIYATKPDMVVNLLAKIGINFNQAIPVTKCTSLIVGFFGDSLLDLGTKKIPYIGREIPCMYIPTEVQQQAARERAKEAGPDAKLPTGNKDV